MILLLRKQSLRTLLIILTILLVVHIIVFEKIFLLFEPRLLSISFLDVGQGDAIYIKTPNGNDMLIDGGPDNSVLRELKKIMNSDDRFINIVTATHPDKDHIAGLASIFDTYTIDHIIYTATRSATQFDKTLHEKIAQEKHIVEHVAHRGMRIVLDPDFGVFLDILFPLSPDDVFSDTNDASIVMRLFYKQTIAIFTGDAPMKTETMIINLDQEKLETKILQLGHHGSKTSTSDMFLKTTQPNYAVASAGKNNRYGHPANEVVNRVLKNNTPLLTTKELGTITFLTDGNHVWRK